VLILLAGPGGELKAWDAPADEAYSRSIVARVVASRTSECVLDTRESDALRTQASILDLQVRSVMCVPLVVEQALHGVVYVDSQVALGAFGPDDLRVVEAIAAQAAVALDGARLFQAMRRQNDQLQRQLRLLEEKDTKIAALRDYDQARAAAFEAESHDLRAPLAAISAACQGLLKGLEGELTEPQAAMVDGVLLNARMLTRKIDGILDGAGAAAGRITLRLQDLDLSKVVDEIVRGLRPSAEGKGLVLSWDAEAFRRVPKVRADERRVGQMVQNLVDNAIKYTGAGEVTVTAVVEGGVRLVVADTGPGLPAERLAAPFERYGARTVSVPGSGVGLWRVKALMDQHGGDVVIESEPGRGTRIALAFPAWPALPGEEG
jgi:signal transduction histidine kinase